MKGSAYRRVCVHSPGFMPITEGGYTMIKLNYNPHNKKIDTSFTPPPKVGRGVTIWMSEDLIYRIKRIVSEQRLASFSWAISEAAYQWAEGIESFEELIRRDKRELREVPE